MPLKCSRLCPHFFAKSISRTHGPARQARHRGVRPRSSSWSRPCREPSPPVVPLALKLRQTDGVPTRSNSYSHYPQSEIAPTTAVSANSALTVPQANYSPRADRPFSVSTVKVQRITGTATSSPWLSWRLTVMPRRLC